MSHLAEHLVVAGKVTGEVVALGAIAGAIMEWLPALAAGFAILWHVILIYDWCRKRNK